MIDYGKFRKALRNLERQFENYSRLDERSDLSRLDREAVAESVIQRFEICYDTLWKHLKRYLIKELGIAEVPDSPKPVFRLAAENLLLDIPIEDWFAFADARTATAQDYSGEKAEDCLRLTGTFINAASSLYRKLTGETPA